MPLLTNDGDMCLLDGAFKAEATSFYRVLDVSGQFDVTAVELSIASVHAASSLQSSRLKFKGTSRAFVKTLMARAAKACAEQILKSATTNAAGTLLQWMLADENCFAKTTNVLECAVAWSSKLSDFAKSLVSCSVQTLESDEGKLQFEQIESLRTEAVQIMLNDSATNFRKVASGRGKFGSVRFVSVLLISDRLVSHSLGSNRFSTINSIQLGYLVSVRLAWLS